MTTTSNNKPDLFDQADTIAADAALEALLKDAAEDYRSVYIDNDGFSDRVMNQIAVLPKPAVFNVRRRLIVVSAFATLASIIAVFAGSGADLFVDATMDIATETITPAVLGVVAILVTAAALAIAAAASES